MDASSCTSARCIFLPRSLIPGEITEVVFDLLPTSFVFRAGHAIRLAIAGVDAGFFDALLPVSPLVYEFHRDQPYPSRLDLPTYVAPRPPHPRPSSPH